MAALHGPGASRLATAHAPPGGHFVHVHVCARAWLDNFICVQVRGQCLIYPTWVFFS